eukprot:7831946-Karenia_brevis.AAC.1
MRTQLKQLPTQTTRPKSPRFKFGKTNNKLGNRDKHSGIQGTHYGILGGSSVSCISISIPLVYNVLPI